jgi:hypothetical protein
VRRVRVGSGGKAGGLGGADKWRREMVDLSSAAPRDRQANRCKLKPMHRSRQARTRITT